MGNCKRQTYETHRSLTCRGHLMQVGAASVSLGPEWSFHLRAYLVQLWAAVTENAYKYTSSSVHLLICSFIQQVKHMKRICLYMSLLHPKGQAQKATGSKSVLWKFLTDGRHTSPDHTVANLKMKYRTLHLESYQSFQLIRTKTSSWL